MAIKKFCAARSLIMEPCTATSTAHPDRKSVRPSRGEGEYFNDQEWTDAQVGLCEEMKQPFHVQKNTLALIYLKNLEPIYQQEILR